MKEINGKILMTKSTVKPILLILALIFPVLFFLPVPAVYAQWSSEGLMFDPDYNTHAFQLLAEEDGGFWVIWSRVMPGSVSSTRFQRYDLDGYPLFPEGGINTLADSLDPTGWFMGAVRCDDGSISLAINNYTNADIYRVYGQKISPEGELLLGPTGSNVSVYDETEQYRLSVTPRWVTSDGNGGFWILWGTWQYFNDMWISGMNSDGSFKLPDEDIFLGHYNINMEPIIQPELNGGAYIVWGGDPGDAVEHVYAQYVTSEGDPFYEQPQAVLHREDFHFGDPIRVVPDLTGGLYICTMRDWQRVNHDLEPLWGPDGSPVQFPGGVDYPSNAVVLTDNSVNMIGPRNYELFYIRMDSAGTLLFPDGYTVYGTPDGSLQSVAKEFVKHPDGNRTYGFTVIHGYETGYNVQVQLVDSGGVDLWPNRNIHVIEENENRWGYTDVIVTTDSNAVFGIINSDNGHAYLYKIFQDGSIAGRENDVIEQNSNTELATTFQIINTYPNPFNSELKISLDVFEAGTYSMFIYTIEGRLVDSLAYNLTNGLHNLIWKPKNLASGILFMEWSGRNGKKKIKKVVYVR